MLESLIISSVFQSLPTIYPISIEESTSSDYPYQYPPKNKPKNQKFKMERVKKLTLEKNRSVLFPSNLFAKTAGIFDNMMCCSSYAEQQLSGEATEREREYREEASPGLGLELDSPVANKRGNKPDLFQRKMVAPVQYDFVDQRSPPQQHRKGKSASGTRISIGSSYSTATTVTANTYNTTSIDGAGSYDSCASSVQSSSSLRSSSRDRSNRAEMHGLFMRDSPAEQSCRSLTDRTISVPSRRSSRFIELDSEKRRWSEGCVEFEQQQQHHADYYVPNEEVIRKVQSESLAQLPYLSMTEGYRC
jgi:hypothetical protein